MLDAALAHATWLLTLPAVVVPAAVASVVLGTIAVAGGRLLRWDAGRIVGAVLAGVSLAMALSVTLFERLHFARSGPLGFRGCEPGSALGATDVDALLNWFPLVPFGFFATLATRRPAVGAGLSLATAVAIELTQSYTGLGGCQTADIVRNALGGVAASIAAGVIVNLTRAVEPRSALLPGRSR